MPKRLAQLVLIGTAIAIAAPAGAQTAPQQCIGRAGPNPPVFNPATDLAYLLNSIGQLQASPSAIYGPGPWTNWYLEPDQRDQLAKLAVGRIVTDSANL